MIDLNFSVYLLDLRHDHAFLVISMSLWHACHCALFW